MTRPLVIDYYTDVLCIWAWIAQRRIDELHHQWGEQVQLNHHCINVFGDTRAKMDTQWSERGGFDGFAAHVADAAAEYEDAPIHPGLWRSVRPVTSANAHLLLKAAQSVASTDTMVELATRMRQAFFVDAVDIGELSNLLELAADLGLAAESLEAELGSGRAMAALMTDYSVAEQYGIKGSPSWVMNQGRQILYGNVGYRVLHANIEELVRHPDHEASWC